MTVVECPLDLTIPLNQHEPLIIPMRALTQFDRVLDARVLEAGDQ
jgi:hypothetical protein